MKPPSDAPLAHVERPLPSRRDALKGVAAAMAAALALPAPLAALERGATALAARGGDATHDTDRERLGAWTAALRAEGLVRRDVPLGREAVRVAELAAGSPYVPYTLEAYLRAGGSPRRTEPLTLSLTRFDCVSLVESCLAVARATTEGGDASWARFAREVERMRYRGGVRGSYASRLHYFSEWIADGARRGLVRDLGAELGGVEDARPLRFMTEHRASYPALADATVFREIAAMERGLDGRARRVIPAARIAEVSDRIESGDVLAFATAIPGLDVTHSAFAYRDAGGVLRVLHAPLSGGAVEVSRAPLPEYVTAIRRATGILVARPLRGSPRALRGASEVQPLAELPAAALARARRPLPGHPLPRERGTAAGDDARQRDGQRAGGDPRERAPPLDVAAHRVFGRVVARGEPPRRADGAPGDGLRHRGRGHRDEGPLLPLGDRHHAPAPLRCPPIGQRACRPAPRRRALSRSAAASA